MFSCEFYEVSKNTFFIGGCFCFKCHQKTFFDFSLFTSLNYNFFFIKWVNYSWFTQQKENGRKLIEKALEWKLRNVVRKMILAKSFMNKEKQIHKLNIPSQ